ncbi:MAG: putative transport system ATP-binding protein [Actinomycetota bacterium]|jgi:putative ABC transport system ATP-binding protein|nr:putative transport system ATP-binding protein [Actinomycetota bacterium]
MMAAALDARRLYRFFHAGGDEVLALRGVSLRVDAGEIVAVVGPSGSGKSTLLACLAGLDDPDGGQVRIAGEVMTRRSEGERAELRGRAVGVLLQSDNLIGHLDVDGNIGVAQRLAGRSDTTRRQELLDHVGLTGRRRALPAQLSGGEAVRAGLAVALANNPAVLIADEPTGELDSSTEQRVLELLAAEAGAGRAIIVATHSDSVAAVADRVIVLADGIVVG